MELSYTAVCFDLFGTLVDPEGNSVDGARGALHLLPADRWAIVTSCGSAYARMLIASAGLPEPQVLVASDDVERGKPAPDPYVTGAERLRVAPGDVLVVEDSRDGIAAGRSAGMDVLAILRGRGLAFARDASFQVERFSDIVWALDENGSIRVQIEP
ncbi:MAG: HAD-IA family hydrolase [Candidatus Eremiobacteraeota bacterium]|nr:HAD-IA family hydrolase [Candidatus Eremiobacteraeota bacterium]